MMRSNSLPSRLPSALPIRPRCQVDPVDLLGWDDHEDVAAPRSSHSPTAPPIADGDRYSCAWKPHQPHTGRRPPEKGVANFRGSSVDDEGREIVLESTLEQAAASIALANRRTKRVHPQVGRLFYKDTDGEQHHSTLDFVVAGANDNSLAIAVKPKRKRVPSGIDDTMAAIRDQVPGFADAYAVWTEDELPRYAEHNAGLIIRSRRMRNADDVRDLMHLTAKMHGTVRIGDLLPHANCGTARAFTAIVNLIDEGFLLAAPHTRFGPGMPVRVAA